MLEKIKLRTLVNFGRQFLAFVLVTISAAHAAGTQPNIVYIIADDLGWKDTGFHGSDH